MSMVEILFKACAFETRWGNEKGEIMSNIDKYETRKKMVYDFMCDDMYVPMKIKELCIVFWSVNKVNELCCKFNIL